LQQENLHTATTQQLIKKSPALVRRRVQTADILADQTKQEKEQDFSDDNISFVSHLFLILKTVPKC